MEASSDLLTRAVAKVIPEDLAKAKLASGKKLRIYNGVDPTGSKLHIGHTVPLRKLQAFAEAGHEVIFLIGSFTAMIGDPSGRDEARVPLTREQIEENFKTYKEQASKVLDFSKITVVYNHEWLEKLGGRDLLKLASFFTKQQMEQRDMFVRREEEGKPIFINEFLYPLFQGYDSAHLDVDCELGATDQEFNMLAGRTLQKALGKREKFVLTVKIIEGTDGRKMSKTYNNCIYLEDQPADMFGKVMSVKDDLMATYFECCTDVPMDEVKKILQGPPRDAKARLAREIVTLYHGMKAAVKAEEEFDHIFKNKGIPKVIPDASLFMATDSDDLKSWRKESGDILYGSGDVKLIDVMVISKLVKSKNEARRLIQQKAVELNDKLVESIDSLAEPGLLKVGKRLFGKIRNYLYSRMSCSNGGDLHLEIFPLKRNGSHQEINAAVADALNASAMFMKQKKYIHTNDFFEKTHFELIIKKGLVNYVSTKNRRIKLAMILDEYLKPINDVINYKMMIDTVLKKVKESPRPLRVPFIECPSCQNFSLRINDNWISSGPSNVNGTCSNCRFRFSELVN